MEGLDSLTVDSWNDAATQATVPLVLQADGRYSCPKHPDAGTYVQSTDYCQACEKEFAARREQLQAQRASVNEQLQAISGGGNLGDLQASLQQMKPTAEQQQLPPRHPKTEAPPVTAPQQQASSAAAPMPPYMQMGMQSMQQGMGMQGMQSSMPGMQSPMMSMGHLDALTMQLTRMQQMQDWMLMQKEQECSQLKQALEEARHALQELRVENALLTEKLSQQEERMQHELQLIKMTALQQQKSSGRKKEKEAPQQPMLQLMAPPPPPTATTTTEPPQSATQFSSSPPAPSDWQTFDAPKPTKTPEKPDPLLTRRSSDATQTSSNVQATLSSEFNNRNESDYKNPDYKTEFTNGGIQQRSQNFVSPIKEDEIPPPKLNIIPPEPVPEAMPEVPKALSPVAAAVAKLENKPQDRFQKQMAQAVADAQQNDNDSFIQTDVSSTNIPKSLFIAEQIAEEEVMSGSKKSTSTSVASGESSANSHVRAHSNVSDFGMEDAMETWSYKAEEEKKSTSTTARSTGVSFPDEAACNQTVTSSTFGEDRQTVSNKSILDPYGDRGDFTGVILRSTGMPHGRGTMVYQEDKRTYAGEWRHGRWHGFGKAAFANGDHYEGEYRFDQRHGNGRYEWNDGRVYDGAFREDKRHGHGRFEWPDGAVYDGEFRNGQREGKGSYTFSDGGCYNGSWKDGRYSGYGTCSWEDGRCYKGEWLNGMAHGKGIETFADGTVRHDGLWVEDEPVNS